MTHIETPEAQQSIAVHGDDPSLAHLLRGLTASGRTLTDDLGSADLVIVAADQDLAATQSTVQAVAASLDPKTTLAVSTDLLSITEIALGADHPERIVGLHHFAGGHARGTVEVVRGQVSAAEHLDAVTALVDSVEGLFAIVVKDRPGFLLNALFVPYLNDVLVELDEELASAHDLDVALELGLGYRTGPLALIDRIGVQQHLETSAALYAATGDVRYRPPAILHRVAATGQRFRSDLPDIEDRQ